MQTRPTKPATPEDDQLFVLLRQLEKAPEASQRSIAEALGVSLGRLNAQLRTAVEAGLITVTNRPGPDRRQRFAYALTETGTQTKDRLVKSFLARKFAEYAALHTELTGSVGDLMPLKYRSTLMQSNLAPIPELYVSYDSAQKLKVEAAELTSHDLSPRQICDLELLMNGGFNPLKGFLSEEDYTSVVDTMRLADGSLWPMPITLDVSEKFADTVEIGQDIALRDQEGVILATMTVTDKWEPNKAHEAEKVFGADDSAHPAVNYLHNQAGKIYLGGPVTGIQQPVHYDFRARRDTPNELRAYFRKLGWRKVVAFQTRNPLHRAHQELTFRAAKEAQANLLIHPVVGMTKPGDVDHFTRVRCYEAVLDKYPQSTTTMSPAEPRHAHGWPARGGLARADPRQPRLHPLHRRPRPRRPRQELARARISTAPMTRRICSASIRTKSAPKWSTSSTWSMCRSAPNTSRRMTRSKTRTTSPS